MVQDVTRPPSGEVPPMSPVTVGASDMSNAAVRSVSFALGLGRLRRVTSSGRFIPEIDGLRFVAILTVYLYHLSEYLRVKSPPSGADPSSTLMARILGHGGNGVQLFFVISGFVLALPFASHYLRKTKAVSLRAYFLRRLTRLEPPYALSMVLFFIMLIVYVGESPSALLPHLAASLVYLHNVIYGYMSSINGVAWSLEVEIQFYILVPLLARLFAIKSRWLRRSTMVLLIAGTVVMQWFTIPAVGHRLSISIFNYLQYFLLGFLLADVYLTDWNQNPTPSWAWDAVAFVGWPLLVVVWEFPVASMWLFPPMTFVLYCATFRGIWSRRLLTNTWITTIGGMCYSIYLLHQPVISFIARHTVHLEFANGPKFGFLVQFLLVTPIVLAVCTTYFSIIEKPCMNPDWPQRLAARVRSWASLGQAA
jgi:peptidoglycan/LPS O-acetylase OafA/YrhL